MYQVTGRDRSGEFCAGLIVSAGQVVKSAPKLGYMRGWKLEAVREYCQGRGWSMRPVHGLTADRLPDLGLER